MDYIASLTCDEVRMLLKYLQPPEQTQKQDREALLKEKLEKFKRIKEAEARQK